MISEFTKITKKSNRNVFLSFIPKDKRGFAIKADSPEIVQRIIYYKLKNSYVNKLSETVGYPVLLHFYTLLLVRSAK